jgi:hypothetical protein
MQLTDIQILTLYILQFIPSLVLSILYFFKIREIERQEQKPAFVGLITFTLLSILILAETICFYFTFILSFDLLPIFGIVTAALFSATILLLASWTLAVVKPEWLHDRMQILAITGLILWVSYTGTYIFSQITFNINLFLIARFIIVTVIFVFMLGIALLGLKDDKLTFLLFIGLLLVYINSMFGALVLFINITLETIIWIGIWLILIWYILTKRRSI